MSDLLHSPRIVLFLLLVFALTSPAVGEAASSLVLTILHDNYVADPALHAEWGFACLIEGLEETILFDTGASQCALRANLRTAGIDPAAIDAIVLSHSHADHIGGFECLLPLPKETALFIPAGFRNPHRARFEVEGANISWGRDPIEICNGATTTGEIDGPVNEQSLVFRGPDGLIVITGCAHPGITRIVRTAVSLFPKEPVDLVIGGFHLLEASETTLRSIAVELHSLGVQRVAPTHCSGDRARSVFREVFGEHCVEAGVGFVIAW